jgi:hypothetical protein
MPGRHENAVASNPSNPDVFGSAAAFSKAGMNERA